MILDFVNINELVSSYHSENLKNIISIGTKKINAMPLYLIVHRAKLYLPKYPGALRSKLFLSNFLQGRPSQLQKGRLQSHLVFSSGGITNPTQNVARVFHWRMQ
jgi:hypothetical protein